MVFDGRALVVCACRRIGADDKEVVGRGQALVARAGRQHCDVAGPQCKDPSCPAAEADTPLAARDAEHLMDSGVIVYVVIDTIAPGVAPSVSFEQVLDHGRRIVAPI